MKDAAVVDITETAAKKNECHVFCKVNRQSRTLFKNFLSKTSTSLSMLTSRLLQQNEKFNLQTVLKE